MAKQESSTKQYFDIELLQPMFDQLLEIAKLAPDWDSYGADPPAAQAIAAAAALLIRLYGALGKRLGTYIQPNHISPLADGGMQLEWSGSQAEIEVQISPTGTFGYLLTQKQGTHRTFEEAEEAPAAKIIQMIVDVVRHG